MFMVLSVFRLVGWCDEFKSQMWIEVVTNKLFTCFLNLPTHVHCATRCEEYSAHHDGKSTHCQVLPCSHWPWRRHQPLQHTGRAPYASISDCLRCKIYLGSKQPLPLQALHNTNLLASYAAIDRRVKILCYVMKVFAKVSMISPLNQRSCHSSTVVLFHLCCTFFSCIFTIFDFPFTDVRHRGCFSWQPLIVRLHPHGALLPPAEEPSCYSRASRGTNNKCCAFSECKPHSSNESFLVLAKCYIHMESGRQ